ncbi:MAG: hypothetical protein WD066_02025 [Planctomycetaceae bacterium]
MFDTHTIAGGLFAHWADEFPLDVPTVFPGTEIDLADAAEWIDISLDAWSDRVRRHGGKRRVTLMLSVHCFAKPSTDHGRADELADAAEATLAGRTISIRDADESGLPIVGYVKLFEPQARDLSRSTREAGDAVRHIAVRIAGVAEEV